MMIKQVSITWLCIVVTCTAGKGHPAKGKRAMKRVSQVCWRGESRTNGEMERRRTKCCGVGGRGLKAARQVGLLSPSQTELVFTQEGSQTEDETEERGGKD